MINPDEILLGIQVKLPHGRRRLVKLLNPTPPTAGALYKREWMERPGNREKARKKARDYYRNDPQGEMARATKWVEDNRERARAIWRASKERNRDTSPKGRRKEALRVAAWRTRKRAIAAAAACDEARIRAYVVLALTFALAQELPDA